MHLLILRETPTQQGEGKDFEDTRGRGGERFERNGRRESGGDRGDRNGGGRFDRGGDRGGDRNGGRGRDDRGGRFERGDRGADRGADRGGDRGGDRFERGSRPSFGGRDRQDGGGAQDYGNDRGEQRREPEAGMSRLFLNVGHKMRIGPRDIVGAIAGETGLPGKMIGAIDIRDRFSFVEVPTEHADEVMNVMSGNQIRGYPMVVERGRRRD